MDLDDFRRRLDRLFSDHAARPDQRAYTTGLHGALVEAKAAVDALRSALTATRGEHEGERGRLEDAERRGRLAAGIADQETVELAGKFAGKHRDRVALLERKLGVQEEELRMAEAQVEELTELYRSARQGTPPPSGGAAQPDDPDTVLLRRELDQQARAAAVEAQLAALKRKLGK